MSTVFVSTFVVYIVLYCIVFNQFNKKIFAGEQGLSGGRNYCLQLKVEIVVTMY